jgi:hypothetical protein
LTTTAAVARVGATVPTRVRPDRCDVPRCPPDPLVAVNLQTAFLSPPVAMAAFYLKGISPPHVTLNQIFNGMYPFLAIQLFCLFLTWYWPELTLWLPRYLYGD